MFYLTPLNLNPLISALEQGSDSIFISPDLSISQITLPLQKNFVELGGKRYSLEEMRKLAKKLNGILLIEQGREEPLEFFAGRYYKLRPTESAPTIEIDGIQMHRTKEINPWEDSRRKAFYVVRPRDMVLDTCGGLGYTAIWAAMLGARKVISCEKDTNVLRLREKNPWSNPIKQNRIEEVCCDIYYQVREYPARFFHTIIHDPPRFALAGELYGQEFYYQLNRILKVNGRLFHYTGDPYSQGRGRKFIPGIISRLQQAGFKSTSHPEDLGLEAVKIKNI